MVDEGGSHPVLTTKRLWAVALLLPVSQPLLQMKPSTRPGMDPLTGLLGGYCVSGPHHPPQPAGAFQVSGVFTFPGNISLEELQDKYFV